MGRMSVFLGGIDIAEGDGEREKQRRMREGRTLCFSRSSLLRGALMMTRRTLDGALKWALRDFLREEWRAVGASVST